MKQQSFCDIEYSNRRRKTKREEFLDSMNEIIPWDQWIEFIRPYYYSNKRGRRPKDIEVMLRMYLMQNWFNLSDEGIEEAIYDSYAMRSFLGINFIDEQVPDATTLLKFRHLLEKHHIGEKIFKDVSDRLEKAGLKKMMKSAMEIPDTAEWKRDRRSRIMSISAISNSGPMSDHPVLRSHPATQDSTGIRRLKTENRLSVAKWNIRF